MANIIEILVQITGADAANKDLMSFGAKLAAVGAGVTVLGSQIESKFSKPIRDAFGSAVHEAALLQESMSLTAQIFGNTAQEVIGWAREMSASYLLSTSELLTHTGLLTKMLEQTGIDAATAFPMVQKLVERGTDLALMYNKEVPDALAKFKSGLSDNIRPLREFGVFLDAATVKAKAVELGLIETSVSAAKLEQATLKVTKAQQNAVAVLSEYGAESMEYREAVNKVDLAEESLAKVMEGKVETLTTAQKIQAKYALLLEQTAYAEGFAATEAQNWMFVQHELNAVWKNFLAEAMLPILPLLAQLVLYLIQLIRWFTDLNPIIQYAVFAFLAMIAALGPILLIVGQVIMAVAGLIIIIGALGAAAVPVGIALLALAAIFTKIAIVVAASVAVWILIWNKWGTQIKAVAADVAAFLVSTWTNILGFLKAAQDQAVAIFRVAWDIISTIFRTVFGVILGLLSAFLFLITGDSRQAMQVLESVFRAAWNNIKGLWEQYGTALVASVKQKWNEIVAAITAAVPRMLQAARNGWNQIKNSVSQINWSAVGRAIITGIANGIRSGVGTLIAAARNAAWAAYNAAMRALGARSPSKLFAHVGESMMQGMAVGIQASQNLPAAASVGAAAQSISSVTNNYYLTARYEYQSPSSLMSDVRLLELLRGT